MKMILHRLLRRLTRWIKQRNSGRTVTKRIHGVTYQLDLGEAIDAALYYRGRYEPSTLAALRRHVEPSMVVFEVGANIGAHTFEIAKLLDPHHGRLYCFEPATYAFSKLERNRELNHAPHVILERIALSDSNGEETITPGASPATRPFLSSWDAVSGGARQTGPETILFQTLDDYCAGRQISAINLLKMHVDGNEMRVLRGARHILQRSRPIILTLLTSRLGRVGDSVKGCIEFLSELGYDVYGPDSREPLTAEQAEAMVRMNEDLHVVCLPG